MITKRHMMKMLLLLAAVFLLVTLFTASHLYIKKMSLPTAKILGHSLRNYTDLCSNWPMPVVPRCFHQCGPLNVPPSVVIISSFPPRHCGVGEYSRQMAEGLRDSGLFRHVEVIALAHDEQELQSDFNRTFVRRVMRRNNATDYQAVAEYINNGDYDVVMIEHEFTLYAGNGGSISEGFALMCLMERLRPVTVTTFHTIMGAGTFTEAGSSIARRSDRLISISKSGQQMLRIFGVDEFMNVHVIPLGTPPHLVSEQFPDKLAAKQRLGMEGRFVLVANGIMHPNKGFHTAIQMMSILVKMFPNTVLYVIGTVFEEVCAEECVVYLNGLKQFVEQNDLQKNVVFVDRYLSNDDLREALWAADIALTPYTASWQIQSSVATAAAAAGCAIISTPFVYAEELAGVRIALSDDGSDTQSFVLLAQSDAYAFAQVTAMLLSDPHLLERMQRAAFEHSRSTRWDVLATQFYQAVTGSNSS